MNEIEEISWSELSGFQEKQKVAHKALREYKYLLYGGAAGGGKSYFLRWVAVWLLMYYFAKYNLRGVRVGLFCENYPALKDRQLNKLKFEFPSWLGTYNQQDHEFRLAGEYGDGVIAFRNLDDPSKYLSSEFASILVDELTKNDKETFDYLILRLRWPGIKDTKFIGATNPGGIGHGWVKKLWVDRDFSEERYDPSEFEIVKAFYSDNQYIDPSYAKQLDALPEDKRRAYKEGDWDIFKGQFFTEFRRDVHVVEPFTDEQTLKWFNSLPTFAGVDYGYANPSCVIFGKIHDDTWYIFQEIYKTELTFEQLKQEIINEGGAKILYCDPSIWAKKDSPISGADKMKPLPVVPAFNEREQGWVFLKQLLKTKKIKIFSNCKNLIRTIPVQVYDDHKVEDLDTDGEDHAADALRYLIATFRKYRELKKPEFTQIFGKISESTSSSDLEELFSNKMGTHDLSRPIYRR